MADRGRPRKPTAKLKLYGSYREDRHGAREDESLAIGEPVKPDGLSDDAAGVWDMVVATLPDGAKSRLDGPMLAGVCEWFALYWRLSQTIKKAKQVDAAAIAVAARAWKCFCDGAAKFGLSPVDRAKIEKAATEPKDDLDSFISQAQ